MGLFGLGNDRDKKRRPVDPMPVQEEEETEDEDMDTTLVNRITIKFIDGTESIFDLTESMIAESNEASYTIKTYKDSDSAGNEDDNYLVKKEMINLTNVKEVIEEFK